MLQKQERLFSYTQHSLSEQPSVQTREYKLTSPESAEKKALKKSEEPSLVTLSSFNSDKFLEHLREESLNNIVPRLAFNKDDIFEPELDEVSSEFVYFMPTLQNRMMNVRQEEDFLAELLEEISEKIEYEKVYLSSAYLNPSQLLYQSLCHLNAKSFELVTAAKEANSFFGAPFPKGLSPYFYQRVLRRLLKQARKARQNLEVEDSSTGNQTSVETHTKAYTYAKPGWTFHSKQLFLLTSSDNLLSDSDSDSPSKQNKQNNQNKPNKKPQMLTTIGSSNFNNRSFFRDNESTVFVYSQNEAFISKVSKEIEGLKEHLTDVDEKKDEKIGFGLLDGVINNTNLL